MTRTDASASPLRESPVFEPFLTALGDAVADERSWLDFALGDSSRQRVLEIAMASEQQSSDAVRYREPAARAGLSRQSSWWPIPMFAFGGRGLDSRNQVIAPSRAFPSTAWTLAVVKTKTDDKHGWLAAGQTMSRAILMAQALGLPWGFFNEVRRREAREALRMGIGHKGFAQVILRFGSIFVGEAIQVSTPVTSTTTFRCTT